MYVTRPILKIPFCPHQSIIPCITKHITCLLLKTKLNNFIKQNAHLSTTHSVYQEDTTDAALPLTKERARELIMRLNVEEREHLKTTLQEIESDKMKDEYKGKFVYHK